MIRILRIRIPGFVASLVEGHDLSRLQQMAYVSLSVNVTIINIFKVAGFEGKERLRSSEIKEDGLRFVAFKVAGFESKEPNEETSEKFRCCGRWRCSPSSQAAAPSMLVTVLCGREASCDIWC